MNFATACWKHWQQKKVFFFFVLFCVLCVEAMLSFQMFIKISGAMFLPESEGIKYGYEITLKAMLHLFINFIDFIIMFKES